MDTITIVMVAARILKERYGAGSVSFQDAYTRVRDALISTADSADAAENVLASLEANPTSPARQLALGELLTTIPADQRVTLRRLANDLINQVEGQRHGKRILQQLDVYRSGTIIVGNISGTGIAIGRDIHSIVFDEAARPPGDPVILATSPKKPPEGTEPPPTTPEEQS